MIKRCIKELRSWIAIYIILGIFIQFVNSLNIVYFQKFVDKLNEKIIPEGIYQILYIYGFLLALVCVLNYVSEYPATYLANSIFEKLKIFAFEKISKIDFQSYQQTGTGELIKVIENGASAGKEIAFSFYLRLLAELIPTIFFNLLFISFYNRKIMIIIIIGYVIVFVITNLLLKNLYKIKDRLLEKQERIIRILNYHFKSIIM